MYSWYDHIQTREEFSGSLGEPAMHEGLDLFNIDEEVGEEIYDEILTYVNDNGYDFIGEEFE